MMMGIVTGKEKSQKLYEEAVELAKEILKLGSISQPIDGRKISELIKK